MAFQANQNPKQQQHTMQTYTNNTLWALKIIRTNQPIDRLHKLLLGEDELMVFEMEVEDGEQDDEHLPRAKRRQSSAAAEGLADDEFSEDDEDEDERGESTLIAANAHLNLEGRGYSTSPSQLDGSDLMRDLHEMSDYADRIDSILDRQAGSSFGHSSLDSRPRRSRSPANLAGAQVESDHDDDDDEVD